MFVNKTTSAKHLFLMHNKFVCGQKVEISPRVMAKIKKDRSMQNITQRQKIEQVKLD